MSKSLHPYYLQQMGIDTWTMRQVHSTAFKLMVVGEALDAKTFNFFKKMLNAIGLSADDVCFKSVHDIPNNSAQLLLILGEAAIDELFNRPLNKLRGQMHMFNNMSAIVSYHPVDLLKKPINKKFAYQDLLFIQKILS